MRQFDIQLIPLPLMKKTEQIDACFAASLAKKIAVVGVWTHPILLDHQDFAIMDGHHRYRAAKLQGFVCAPAIVLSYDDPFVRLDSWRPNESYTPTQIRNIANSGHLLPYKSTRHTVDAVLPRCQIPLEQLLCK